jgi:OOP family OmpA-OmpF porin
MEDTMFQSTKILRALVATLALSTAVGCAELTAPPPQTAAENSPELAGAWYQVYFDTNSAKLNTRGQRIIESVAYIVANNDTTRVTVIGKTDRVGAPPANMDLSQRRAHAVRDALLAAGVQPDRIDTSWTGEGHQDVATANTTAEIRDRVVDITVVKLPG